jgi:long-chain acyl-CoA synthetase
MDTPASVAECLSAYVETLLGWGDRPFLVGRKGYRRDSWSYREVWNAVQACASLLGERGVAGGERVLLLLPQSPEWVVTFFAVLLRGGVVIPLEASSPPQFIEAVRGKTSPVVLIAPDGMQESLGEAPGGFIPLSAVSACRIAPLSKTLSGTCDRGDLAEIVFTSGTTSQPKGVMLSHGNILSAVEPIDRGIHERKLLIKFFPRIRMLCTVPYTHMFGQVTGILLPILLGSTVYFTDDTAPSALIRMIKRNRILTLITVPRILKLLANHVRQEMAAQGVYDRFLKRWESRQHLPWKIRIFSFLSLHRIMGLRFWSFIVGGAALDPDTHEFWRRTVFAIFQGYGLTETAPIVTMFNPFRHPRDSVGVVMPGQELRLAPDGEILVRGGNVMRGYYDDAGSTTEVLENGWFHTGDLGEMDEEGRIFIKGRKKEMILTSDGHNVYPSDVERALNEQPGVRESVVFGRPGPSGEAVHAVLLLETGADPERIVTEANAQLTPQQHIRGFDRWENADFPRTSTMKVRKGEVIRQVLGQKKPAARQDELFQGLLAGPPKREARLAGDLGLDSLDTVELVSRLEKQYGVSLDETIIGPDTTVGEIEELVSGASRDEAARVQRPLHMPRWTRRLPARMARFILTDGILLPLFKLFCRLEVKGLESLRKHEGSRILCANHQSDVDPFALLLALPLRLRRFVAPAMGLNRFYAYFTRLGRQPEERPRGHRSPEKVRETAGGRANRNDVRRSAKGFFHHLSYGIVTLLFQTFPFPQGAAYRPSLEYTGELLDAGFWLLIFPEGRVSMDGSIGEFKGGVSLIAEKTEVPVFPVGIEGMHDVLPPGKWFPCRGRVKIAFGNPLWYRQEGHESFSRRIEEEVRRLAGR